MLSLLERLRPVRPENEIWRITQEALEKTGAKNLLLDLALQLRAQGDSSAIITESTKRWSPYLSVLILRWDLKPLGVAPSRWVSKGVEIVAYHDGNVRVELTYDKKGWKGWLELDQLPHLSLEELPQNLEEMSLEEKVRLAMSIAGHNTDYRHDEENRSLVRKLVEGKGWKKIFP